MKIKESIDWYETRTQLIRSAVYHITDEMRFSEMIKLIDNIGLGVKELSRAEVIARQGHPSQAAEWLNKVNQDIELVEGYLIMATLLD